MTHNSRLIYRMLRAFAAGSSFRARARSFVLPGTLFFVYAAVAGWMQDRVYDASTPRVFLILAAVSAVVAVGLGLIRAGESLLQGIGVLIGLAAVVVASLWGATELGPTLWSRIGPFSQQVLAWYTRQPGGAEFEQLIVTALLGYTVWLATFFAGWYLASRAAVGLALVLPAMIASVSLMRDPAMPFWPITIMVASGVGMVASVNWARKESRWARRAMPRPQHLGGRVFITVIVFLLIISSTGLMPPAAWASRVIDPVIDAGTQQWTSFSDWSNRALASIGLGTIGGGRSNAFGNYQDFGDGFEVSGNVSLSDDPQVLVRTDQSFAPYLSAHSYDVYTGRGWQSGLEQSFDFKDDKGRRIAPELRFAANQELILSPEITQDRLRATTSITPLVPQNGVMLTVESYVSVDQPAVVRMSWQQMQNQTYALSAQQLGSLPPTIQRIANLLLQTRLIGGPGKNGPLADSATATSAIDNELENLSSRGVSVRWDASSDGVVRNLYVTGRLPVYDDVEAVYTTTTSGSSYLVTSLLPQQDEQMLRDAGTAYPSWVTDRYLQLGPTVTSRTIDLARTIVADATNPYDQARLVETYLRNAITYDLSVDAPPEGADLVDYVLFENRRGYCEHYASAMTVMMRSLGVPARTVVGYYPGQYDPARNAYVYPEANAHAWTEVYVPDAGWVRFEPTANRPLDDGEPGSDAANNEPSLAPTPTAAPTEVAPTPNRNADQATNEETAIPTVVAQEPELPEPQALPETGNGWTPPRWVAPMMVLSLIAALAAAGVWLGWHWHLRNLAPAAGLYRRLERIGRLVGVRESTTSTPREFGHRVGSRLPAGKSAVRSIVWVYEEDLYRRGGASRPHLNRATNAWNELKRRLPGEIVAGFWKRRRETR